MRFVGLALLVAVGATVGTLLRASIELVFPHAPGEWPWATFAINILGSLALGALIEALALRGPDTGRRRMLRLGVGTGVVGGFTTYSTFVVEIDRLATAGAVSMALVYTLASVVLGVVAAAIGAGVAASVFGRREPEGEGAA
ncbi:CrcB family protein [Microbacterium sp.]|uniref:CrcB family protein n=1 Tax=Microbacterium sp. TaxID=51671 RepID=UPI002CFA84FA|nr:CrcB family protein [Microbacterium sp.]HWL78508.1 CrcB family protein [Microbacterium sp.]